DQRSLAIVGEDGVRVYRDAAGGAVDRVYDVLADGGPGPQELAGFAVESVDDAGFAGDAGEHFVSASGLDARVDPRHFRRIRRHFVIDQHARERWVEIPMIDEVLVMPDDSPGADVESERRIVVKVVLLVSSERQLRGWGGARRPHVNQLKRRIIAGNHPGADLLAPLQRQPT